MALPYSILQYGIRADQPAAAPENNGIYYRVTDEGGIVEQSDGATWTPIAASGGTPGGSDTEVQYNDAGAFGGISGATTDGTTLTLVAPVLGTPASATLTNATGLPVATGISGLGTGVATALAVNIGSAGAAVVDGGALGTPSSGTLTNATGLPLSTGVTGNLPLANLAQASAASVLLGRGSASGAGDYEEISVGSGLTMTGTTISAAGGGGGALVLLEQHTASNSASLDFTTCISSAYDEYAIEVVGIVPVSNAVNLLMRMSTDGGSSYDSGSNYFTDGLSWRAGAVPVNGGGSGTSINITAMNGLSMGNDSKWGTSWSLRYYTPLSTALYKQVIGKGFIIYNDNATRVMGEVGGQYTSLAAADAFQFLFSSGNIASGTVRVYGLAK